MLLQEPLLLVTAFYLLFVLVIIYVRMDFSISKVSCQSFYIFDIYNVTCLPFFAEIIYLAVIMLTWTENKLNQIRC